MKINGGIENKKQWMYNQVVIDYRFQTSYSVKRKRRSLNKIKNKKTEDQMLCQ